jgi:hypothetical protein
MMGLGMDRSVHSIYQRAEQNMYADVLVSQQQIESSAPDAPVLCLAIPGVGVSVPRAHPQSSLRFISSATIAA